MSNSKLRLGLILQPDFYILEKSVCAITNPLIRALTKRFQTTLIYNQETYDQHCQHVDFLLSLEPKWAAPVLDWQRVGRFRKKLPACPCYVMMSDPHSEQWRESYFLTNNLDYILALYYAPTCYHFKKTPLDRICHYPWAIPDEWVSTSRIEYRGQKEVTIFGASGSNAYSTRNWCRKQKGVKSFAFSGVENKEMSDSDFFQWLASFDAVVAAGSEDKKYGLTTPKYFETMAVGSLLFAQKTDDLERLGLKDNDNCIVFSEENFLKRLNEYLTDPGNQQWLQIRSLGRALIERKHTINIRLDSLETHVRQWHSGELGAKRS
ncbi:Glycosyl transferases group 1 [Candidatus Electrothrix aarhusensis]|uniref:Glycosyl transferases group 1 n=1 Tax=Candidatus Electrothrix aarhusensis TaxID=1859131 RepID=A0A3S3QSX5_9BACT|nr:Glycosyl transferases group 1 [Candidatus Electrothrix aarhusensis]